jgi:tellurite resistance protein TerC
VANRKTLEFFTGYLIELSLSVDNMFVFSMIFGYFAVPPELQRRVLLFGVLGAIVMRITMILAGVWLLSKFIWLFYVFGLFLVFTGIRMLIVAEHVHNLSRNPVVRLMRKFMRMTQDYRKESFFVRINGLLYATPMFGVLLLIETTDLVFAVDSIPAIFAVTTDPFIVFTSNIFAIMGLRALYFLLANMAEHFRYLKYGLAIILIVIGGKMLAVPWVHIPVHLSLGAVGIILLVSVGASVIQTRRTIARDAGDAARIADSKAAEPKRRP